jgi:hypothetical protein
MPYKDPAQQKHFNVHSVVGIFVIPPVEAVISVMVPVVFCKDPGCGAGFYDFRAEDICDAAVTLIPVHLTSHQIDPVSSLYYLTKPKRLVLVIFDVVEWSQYEKNIFGLQGVHPYRGSSQQTN